MTEHAAKAGSRAWAWAAAAVAVGALAGVVAARGAVSWVTLVLLAACGVIAVLTFRRLEIGLVALLFTMPLDAYGRLVDKPVPVTMFHVVLLICLAAWFRLLVTRRDTLRVSWLDIGMGAMVLAGLWSLPFSLAPAATAVSVVRMTFLWGLALLYANGLRDEAGLRLVLGGLFVSGVAVSLIGLAQYAVPGFDLGSVRDVLRAGGAVSYSRVGGFFFDPNFFAAMLSAIAAAAFALLAHAHGAKRVALWGAVSAVIGTTLVVTFSRGGWLGAAAGLFAAMLTAPRGRRAWLVSAVAAVVIAGVLFAPGVLVKRVESIANVESDVSIATRYHMTLAMPQMIADRPVFGTGLGAFEQAYPAYRRPGTAFGVMKPHQVPLSYVVETGMAGLAAEIALAAGLFATYWRRRPRGWGRFEAAALAGTVALLAGTLFENYLYFEYVWLFFGLSVAATRLARTREGT